MVDDKVREENILLSIVAFDTYIVYLFLSHAFLHESNINYKQVPP